jgi:hypothetical protein
MECSGRMSGQTEWRFMLGVAVPLLKPLLARKPLMKAPPTICDGGAT